MALQEPGVTDLSSSGIVVLFLKLGQVQGDPEILEPPGSSVHAEHSWQQPWVVALPAWSQGMGTALTCFPSTSMSAM